jgi:uncharacterized membrane protein YeaQ/YmgE (transglycosylase-associated protein family)
MNLLIWLSLGAVVGFIAYLTSSPRNLNKLVESEILSILGAILGGLLASLVFKIDLSSFQLSSLFIPIISSVALLAGPRLFAGRS